MAQALPLAFEVYFRFVLNCNSQIHIPARETHGLSLLQDFGFLCLHHACNVDLDGMDVSWRFQFGITR